MSFGAALDASHAALKEAADADIDALNTEQCLAMLQDCEKVRRLLPALEHRLTNKLAREATPEELGGTVSHAIADAALISRAEANRRGREAADLGERCGLTGEPMAPVLAATAAAQREGKLGAGQVAVIRRFSHHLPGFIDADTRAAAEAHLAALGTQYRPEPLADLAVHLMDCLNPDGNYTDDDRARRRGLTLGNQGVDGMSALRGWLTPEARASLEAVLAKLAAPRHVQPHRRRKPLCGRPAHRRRHRSRRPQRRPTQPRRPQRRAARGLGVR